jgi:hypothetical protein
MKQKDIVAILGSEISCSALVVLCHSHRPRESGTKLHLDASDTMADISTADVGGSGWWRDW